MNISLSSMAEHLLTQKEVVIYYHIRPDGDAVGSAYALALALQSVGIKANTACADDVPQVFRYLTEKFKGDVLDRPTAVAVDSTKPGRLGRYKNEPIKFCIDHHEGNSILSEFSYIKEDSSSCAEIILELLLKMNVTIDPLMADFLYTGLITDTSCFRALRTNPASLVAAGKLSELGADVTSIARQNFMSKSPERFELESILCSSLRYTCDKKIVSGVITFNDYQKTGISDLELKDIPTILDQISGVMIGIVIRETKPNHCRISLRTSGVFNAVEICKKFGGGGHSTAAGCDIEGAPEPVREKVIEACASYYWSLQDVSLF